MWSAFHNPWQITDTQQMLQNLNYHEDIKWEMNAFEWDS